MGTHLLVDTNCVNSINYGSDAASEKSSIQLLNACLIEKKPFNVTKENNIIFWTIKESDGTYTHDSTIFSEGFYTLEDIQIALNNDLKFKGCSIQFQIKYDTYFMNKITIFKIKPPNCKQDVFLVGKSLLASMGFNLNNWLENFPVTNTNSISLFPYAKYELHVDIIDPNINLLNGEPTKLMCFFSYPFHINPIKKETVNRFSQINFDVYESSRKVKANYFQFSFILNGE